MPNIDETKKEEKVTKQGLKTINIKGKEYVAVNERLKYFRENEAYKGWSLTSEIVEMNDSSVRMIAKVFDQDGKLRATGHAFEDRKSSMVNQTSYLENCETSCWGRCLANLGIGIDVSIASVEEVNNALHQQDKLQRKETNESYSNEQVLLDNEQQLLMKEWQELCKQYGSEYVKNIYIESKLGKPLTREKLDTLSKKILEKLREEKKKANEEKVEQ